MFPSPYFAPVYFAPRYWERPAEIAVAVRFLTLAPRASAFTLDARTPALTLAGRLFGLTLEELP